MLTVFLPCRLGSQRVPDKNIRKFGGIEGGLLKIKLDQLLKCKRIDRIIVSSNDPRILAFTNDNYSDARIVTDSRPNHLGLSTTTTDELINYVPTVASEGHILWTHVTSPFLDEFDYENIIEAYFNSLKKGHDSLMTVTKLQGFIWRNDKPISYNRNQLKWPMTQNIEPLYEVDSGAFITSTQLYKDMGDRIGAKPYFYIQEKAKSMDIDWPEDFELAEKLFVNSK